MTISDKLKLIRHENFWSQEEAAWECEISYSEWVKLENEIKTDPRLSTLVKIASRVRKSIDWLVDYLPDWRRIFKDNNQAGGY